MYPIYLIACCAISTQQKSDCWLEVKPHMNEYLLTNRLQLILWWSSDILLGASLQLESSVILTIESHLQGKSKKKTNLHPDIFWHVSGGDESLFGGRLKIIEQWKVNERTVFQ